MTQSMLRSGALLGTAVAAAVALVRPAAAENEVHLHEIPDVYGIAVDRADPEIFRVATAFGLFRIEPDGRAVRTSPPPGLLTELVVHPERPATLYSSGWRSKTEKLGVIRSDDNGRTWTRISAGGPDAVAFHAMAISPGDPSRMYGVGRVLRESRDGGRTWTEVGPMAADVFDIAVSSRSPDVLYAATRAALLISRDGGRTWAKAHPFDGPATMIDVAPDGRVHAFIYGVGLIRAREPDLDWSLVSDGFEDRALINLAVDPRDGDRMLAVVDTGAVMISTDGGRSWIDYEGRLDATPERIAAGEKLYRANCMACHGERGVGERPDDMYARDENGMYVAPPLDDSAHGWHHPDEQLVETILEGSPRNPRMKGLKGRLSRDDARSVVAYIKSLWSFRSRACQGSRHMKCQR